MSVLVDCENYIKARMKQQKHLSYFRDILVFSLFEPGPKCHFSFDHLRNIPKLRPVLSRPELEMIIHAFVFSRLDDCNSVFTRLSRNRLQ